MEVADSPTSEAVAAGHAPAARREERPMVFFRRPDLSGQQLLFHRPRVGAPTTAQQQLATPTPAQLVTLDGQSQLGVPAVAQQSDGGLAVPEPAASSRSSRGDRPPRVSNEGRSSGDLVTDTSFRASCAAAPRLVKQTQGRTESAPSPSLTGLPRAPGIGCRCGWRALTSICCVMGNSLQSSSPRFWTCL